MVARRVPASITYADGLLYIHFANGYVALADADPKLKKYTEKEHL